MIFIHFVKEMAFSLVVSFVNFLCHQFLFLLSLSLPFLL
jgi:hypothetical protein